MEFDNCTHGSLRLVNSTTDGGVCGGVSSCGRVELCLNQAWGTVCGDQFGYDEASVACRQLVGFSDEGMYVAEMKEYLYISI